MYAAFQISINVEDELAPAVKDIDTESGPVVTDVTVGAEGAGGKYGGGATNDIVLELIALDPVAFVAVTAT